MKVVHAVVTDAFAGTERYVVEVAAEQTRQGLEVTVLGGPRLREHLPPEVRWLPGGNPGLALLSTRRLGRQDVAHGHLTYGEAVLTLSRGVHRGRCLATRHVANARGRSLIGHLVGPLVERQLDRELAISHFVAQQTAVPPGNVVHNGVAARPLLAPDQARAVVMAHRLEPEKATELGLAVWFASGLPERGVTLLVAGDGSERAALERLAARHPLGGSVTFLGAVRDMASLWLQALVLLAPATAEPLGLSVLEAMAQGIPVLAAAAGGHLETLHGFPSCLFPVGDAEAGGRLLTDLVDPGVRAQLGPALRVAQQARFDLPTHVRTLTAVYGDLLAVHARSRAGEPSEAGPFLP